jgi:hypothetical protein
MPNAPAATHPRPRRWLGCGLVALFGSYLLLLIPEAPAPPLLKGAGQPAFRWNRDAFWTELETRFRAARTWDAASRLVRFHELLEPIHRALDFVAGTNLPPEAPVFNALEQSFFEFAPIAAACPEQLPDFLAAATRLSRLVKSQSEHWSANSPAPRQRLYRLLYGGRAAVEEALLQSPRTTNALMVHPDADVAATPGIIVQGVPLHSGDILVSRGGAATSALIARGNNYPGNFSHVALVQVDEATKQVSVIEAHIESGVGVRPVEQYLGETKFRILVLRLRGNLSQLRADPLLPHKAASLALRHARERHIPYDFAMDHTDSGKQFCSEVASSAYQTVGVTLWANRSHLSTPGVVSWLGALGVRNFETQEPSDLEFDPQLQIIAEWRDPDTLFQDHVDNAVIDAMLETAERGVPLDFHRWKLPAVRLAKVWSVLLNQFGGVGPVPEGMSATTALRVQKLKADHAAGKAYVLAAAGKFQAEQGYVPPYWELLRFAREALVE